MTEERPENPRGGTLDALVDRATAVDIKLLRAEQRLTILWKDGHRSEFHAPALRQNCPCAACRERRAAGSSTSLPVLDPAAAANEVLLTGAELVGRYAVKLMWSDGHDAGIFDFRYLRSLDKDFGSTG